MDIGIVFWARVVVMFYLYILQVDDLNFWNVMVGVKGQFDILVFFEVVVSNFDKNNCFFSCWMRMFVKV